MNAVILVGRLARNPELRYTPEGHPVTSFTVAVERLSANKDADREADFVNCVAWRRLAEQVGQYGRKGRLVMVQGRLQVRSYDAKDGTRRKAAEVVVSLVRFLDKPKAGSERPAEAQPQETIADPVSEETTMF